MNLGTNQARPCAGPWGSGAALGGVWPLFAALLVACSAPADDGEPEAGAPTEEMPGGAPVVTPAAPNAQAPDLGAPGLEPRGAPGASGEGNPTPVGVVQPGSPGAGNDDDASASSGDPEPAPPPVTGAGPVIPEPNGECPELTTGTHQILGLSTEIVAGEPQIEKGPLLFTWHGTGGSGRQALFQLPQSVQRDITQRGGIVVAPSDNGQVRAGTDVTFVLGVWYDGADLQFADQIVACAVKNHNVDPRQIYVTGCSAGGLMAGVMSLERSSYVAAVAPNSGGVTAPTFRIQDAAHVPAVMTMHGGSTDNVIVNFGETSQAFEDIMKPLGAFVVECNHGSGHCGAPASLHEKAWEFMLAHPFGTSPSPYAAALPADFPDICAIQ